MGNVTLTEGVHWVGAIDWNIRNFHGYSTRLGTSYNAYLVVDDKVTLIDTVKAPFYEVMVSRVKEIVSLDDIDYVVSNHVEMDHSGSLPMIMRDAKNARLITLEKFGEGGLRKTFHSDWPMDTVKEGSELDLGKRKIVFIPTPMLHWPDSMCSYLLEDKILFSMDAFGQHIASSLRFDDEVGIDAIMPEAAKYYANILMPFGDLIVRAVDKLSNLDIDMIAPSHGVIWRTHLDTITKAYTSWGKGESKNKALVIYDTMWGSTEKMAHAIAEGIMSEDIEVKLYNLTRSDHSDIITEVLDTKAILIGSPTLNNGIFPSVAGFLCYLKGLKPKGKLGAAFGSHGWAGGAVKAVEQELGQASIDVIDSGLAIRFVPDEEELQKCTDFGKTIAVRMRKDKED
ncbi:MAG TPA: FprA family A-type flavoprotein [Dehalococcoidia bacterium]|nr:FprA family A-type flavoprotein [Dehalococcoidia bacterium]